MSLTVIQLRAEDGKRPLPGNRVVQPTPAVLRGDGLIEFAADGHKQPPSPLAAMTQPGPELDTAAGTRSARRSAPGPSPSREHRASSLVTSRKPQADPRVTSPGSRHHRQAYRSHQSKPCHHRPAQRSPVCSHRCVITGTDQSTHHRAGSPVTGG